MFAKERNKDEKTAAVKIPELLAPAGNLEKLITAVHYGADAVYLGGKTLSLRAKAGNFSMDDMVEGVDYAHKHGVKVYVTTNIFAHNKDLDGLEEYFIQLWDAEVDGIIVSDPGILHRAKQVVPQLEIHLSTQANVTNTDSVKFWQNQGVSRINVARELSLEEITQIREASEIELEVFVHGALCISYSGRCMLSNYMTDRDANHGKCSHPCRFSYALVEEKRPGEYYPVEEDERGTYIFNSKDLCLLQVLPQLVAAGVDSLKIEGRMKSVFYVGGVVRLYRAVLDYLATLPHEMWQNPDQIVIPQHFFEELKTLGTRGVTQNFFLTPPTHKDMLYHSSRSQLFAEPVAIIRAVDENLLVEIRNPLFTGDRVTMMAKGLNNQEVIVKRMYNERGEPVEKANPGNRIILETEPVITNAEIFSIMRREKL